MSKHSASVIARTLGIKKFNRFSYGQLNNLLICASNEKFTGTLSVNIDADSDKSLDKIYSFLDTEKKKLLIKYYTYKKPYLIVNMDSHFGALTAKRMASSCNIITSFLQTLGITSSCAACGASQVKPAGTSEGVVYLCDICLKQAEHESEDILSARKTSGSYARGFLGAAVGGLIGIIPWVILGLLGTIGAVSGLIMAVLCTKMYTVFKGKIGKLTPLIIILMLIIFTAVGIFAAWFVHAVINGKTLLNSIMLYIFDDMTITGIFGDIIIGLFLAGIGAFSMIRGVMKDASGEGFKITRLSL